MSWLGSKEVPQSKVQLSDEMWDLLAELAEGNDYWSEAHDFMKSIHGRELSFMSEKQVDWFYNIESSLGRELQLREAKEAWGEDSEQAKRIFDELYGGRKYTR